MFHNQKRQRDWILWHYDILNTHSFASRFNLYSVEECAKATWKFLREKQEKKKPPNADKEVDIMINKLQKVEKSLKKQKTM